MALVVAGIVVALALPKYTCRAGGLEEIRIDGDPTGEVECSQSDLGYQPRSWLPTKVAVGTGGLVAAGGLALGAQRRWLAASALVVLFAAGTLGWFLPNGSGQPMRGGQPVCCGRVVDRSAIRASVAVSGFVIAATLVAADVVRHRRRT
ncbi:MAG: hypothetical protein ACRDGW_11595 [Actinomycetota bacterium]